MWARRCGAPPTWPSKVKVFLFSIGTGAIGLTIYTFMASSNIGYLDLSRPSEASSVLCLRRWPLRNELGAWFDQESWDTWLEYQSDMAEYPSRYACSASSQANATCSRVQVPLHGLTSKLGYPLELGRGTAFNIREALGPQDVLGIYAHLFLVLSICLWLAVSFHDQALLHTTSKDYILDVIGLMRYFPRFNRATKYLMGWRVLRRLLRCRAWGRCPAVLLALVLAPALLLWRLLVFMFVVCPLAGVVFLCYPIRTSRLWILLICIASSVYGVCLSVHMLYFLNSPGYRPRYAVTWESEQCTCGCVYPVSGTTCGRLLMIGLLASVKAFVIGFRSLKGLRRSNWANLMSVTFAVPVNAYSVEWEQPNGRPIKSRGPGDPVQSELAFDPFALMDEQPESNTSHVTLRPSSVLRREVDAASGATQWRPTAARRLQGPNLPNFKDMEVEEFERVGCCGFPRRTSGLKGRLQLPSTGGCSERSLGACSPRSDVESGGGTSQAGSGGTGRFAGEACRAAREKACAAPASPGASPGLPRIGLTRTLSSSTDPAKALRTASRPEKLEPDPTPTADDCGAEVRNLQGSLPSAFFPVVARRPPPLRL